MDLNQRVLTVMIVFVVIMTQTVIIKIAYEANADSALIVICGCILADILSICTWYLMSEKVQ